MPEFLICTIGILAKTLLALVFGSWYRVPMPRKFTAAEEKDILELHDGDHRLRDICAKFGAPHGAIQTVLKRHGRKPHPRRILRGARLKEAIELYLTKNLSFRNIASHFGVTEWTVRHELELAGVKSRDRRIFTQEEQEEIAQRYESGETTTGLSRDLDCSEETIRSIVLLKIGHLRPKRKLNTAIADNIVRACVEGKNISQIAPEVGVDSHSVRTDILRAGVGLLGGSEIDRTRPSDTRVFRNPDDEGLYWIGFLMADGCVTESDTLWVGLQSLDRSHLEKFRRFLKSDAPIRDQVGNASSFKPGSPAVFFSVCSKDIVDDLAEWGAVPRKGLSGQLLGDQMSRHTWRGVVDGDGSVSFHKRGYLELRLHGSKYLCEQFRKFILTLVPNCRAKVCDSRKSSGISLCCKPAETVAIELYRDCTTYLDRKFHIVKQIMKRRRDSLPSGPEIISTREPRYTAEKRTGG